VIKKASGYGRGARLQVPISEKGFPFAKLMLPESLHFALAATGAFPSRNRVVTPELGALLQALPSEWKQVLLRVLASRRVSESWLADLVIETQATALLFRGPGRCRPGSPGPGRTLGASTSPVVKDIRERIKDHRLRRLGVSRRAGTHRSGRRPQSQDPVFDELRSLIVAVLRPAKDAQERVSEGQFFARGERAVGRAPTMSKLKRATSPGRGFGLIRFEGQ
jgi:hypothetical protein